MPLSSKMDNPKLRRLSGKPAEPLPTDSMKSLFDAKGAEPEPTAPSLNLQEEILWASWDLHCEAHGAYCSMWSAKLLERQTITARIIKGKQYVAEHAGKPGEAEGLALLAKLEASHDAVTVAMETLDGVIEREAELLAQVENRIKQMKGIKEPMFVCGRCRNVIVQPEDHSQSCRDGWLKVIAAYEELRKQSEAKEL